MTLTTNFGEVPKLVELTLTFTSAIYGYVIGDKIKIGPNNSISGLTGIGPIVKEYLNTLVLVGPSVGIPLINGSTGYNGASIDPSNYTVKVRAWA